MEPRSRKKRGVKRQVSGCVLLSLGLLNLMLTLKAGLRLDTYNFIILASGALLLLSGLLAKEPQTKRAGA